MTPAARTLARTLAATLDAEGRRRSVRQIAADLVELGHRTSPAAVGRLLGPRAKRTPRPRPSRAKPPALVLVRAALRLAGDAKAARELLVAALAELGPEAAAAS
jgi:hypothetical protein